MEIYECCENALGSSKKKKKKSAKQNCFKTNERKYVSLHKCTIGERKQTRILLQSCSLIKNLVSQLKKKSNNDLINNN